MPDVEHDLVDWSAFVRTRTQLGAAFVRILGYFREDGAKSVLAIEEAMRNNNAAGLILPAHTLKSEARQFGGEKLGKAAEDIEMFGRHCVEVRQTPEDYLDRVATLRGLWNRTIAEIDAEANPLVQRRSGFGKRVA